MKGFLEKYGNYIRSSSPGGLQTKYQMDLATYEKLLTSKEERASRSNVQSTLFLNLGLVVSLLLVVTAFEWKFYDEGNLMDLGQVDDTFEDMMDIPPTEQPPPPPPKLQQPQIIEVPDEEEIAEEIEIDLDVEVTEETVIEDVVFEEAPEEEVAEEIHTIVEEKPEPEGGILAFYAFINKNLRYPVLAKRMGIQGKVFVQFVIDKDGSIIDPVVVKGIGGGCDEEAIRVIGIAPKWKPGKQRGRPVKVLKIIPIHFVLKKR